MILLTLLIASFTFSPLMAHQRSSEQKVAHAQARSTERASAGQLLQDAGMQAEFESSLFRMQEVGRICGEQSVLKRDFLADIKRVACEIFDATDATTIQVNARNYPLDTTVVYVNYLRSNGEIIKQHMKMLYKDVQQKIQALPEKDQQEYKHLLAHGVKRVLQVLLFVYQKYELEKAPAEKADAVRASIAGRVKSYFNDSNLFEIVEKQKAADSSDLLDLLRANVFESGKYELNYLRHCRKQLFIRCFLKRLGIKEKIISSIVKRSRTVCRLFQNLYDAIDVNGDIRSLDIVNAWMRDKLSLRDSDPNQYDAFLKEIYNNVAVRFVHQRALIVLLDLLQDRNKLDCAVTDAHDDFDREYHLLVDALAILDPQRDITKLSDNEIELLRIIVHTVCFQIDKSIQEQQACGFFYGLWHASAHKAQVMNSLMNNTGSSDSLENGVYRERHDSALWPKSLKSEITDSEHRLMGKCAHRDIVSRLVERVTQFSVATQSDNPWFKIKHALYRNPRKGWAMVGACAAACVCAIVLIKRLINQSKLGLRIS